MKLLLKTFLFSILILVIQPGRIFGESSDNITIPQRNTTVTIEGEKFFINGSPTYEGRTWTTSYGGEHPVEGLLMNARLVQGIFDDLNKKTRGQWGYPDTKVWDPERNTDEFVRAMASWKEHGLLAFTLNLQGGCPYGYCSGFPWDNSAFAPDGSLREPFMQRAERILDRADELGMVVILGLFYFGEDGTLKDEEAVKKAVVNATKWVLNKGYFNVVIEINNECTAGAYNHEILRCERVHELIKLVQETELDSRSLYVTTSLAGGLVPPDNIVEVSDYILIHGNGVQDYKRITEISQEVRQKSVYRPMPLVNNEDDIPWRNPDQGWGEKGNNFVASVKSYTSWGYFDFRLPDEKYDYNQGFQSIPVNWSISSYRKRDFFNLLANITGYPGTPHIALDFSRRIGEKISLIVDEGPSDIEVRKLELIVNNKTVVETQHIQNEWFVDEFNQDIMKGEHWIKARLTYMRNGHEIVVESPYYKNPWWPYGGLWQD